MKIYIDIGHGEGGDPGAVSKPLIEHEMAKVTGAAMADQFRKLGAQVQVEPGNLPIGESARRANLYNAGLLLSIHYNAGGGDRGEVIYSWKRGAQELADVVAGGLKKAGQTVVRVYKSKANSAGNAEYFGILRVARMPAVIIEPAFIDNAADRQLVDTLPKQKQMGIALANAIADAYGLEGQSMAEPWKEKLMQDADKAGLIDLKMGGHKPDETATKWFVLAVALNLLKAINGGK